VCVPITIMSVRVEMYVCERRMNVNVRVEMYICKRIMYECDSRGIDFVKYGSS